MIAKPHHTVIIMRNTESFSCINLFFFYYLTPKTKIKNELANEFDF
jgi:hypothetical protein